MLDKQSQIVNILGPGVVRDLDGVRLAFVRFHDAAHVIVEDDGRERVLRKSVWALLPVWKDPQSLRSNNGGRPIE